MLEVGWTELLVVGALALIVVGPRELPQLLRQVGRWVGQIKRLGREFQRSIEDAARETDIANVKELRDLRKDLGSLDFRTQDKPAARQNASAVVHNFFGAVDNSAASTGWHAPALATLMPSSSLNAS